MRLWLLGMLLPALAGAVTLPYTFTTSTPPGQVNANFSAVRDAINAHEALENGHNTSLEDVLDVNPSVGGSYINFNLKELFSARVENLGADPSCGGSSLGRLIWNTADGLLKVCNGTSYVSIAGTGVNTLASVLTAGNEASTDIDLDGNALINAKIESLASDPSPGNTGRIFYHTGDEALKLDTGTSIQTLGGAQNLSSVLAAGNVASDDIDFDGNQALNLYGEKLSSDPGGSDAGRIYYNNVDNIFKFHNGTSWLEVGNTNNLSDVLALGNSAGANGINLNGNQLTNVIIHKNAGDPSVGTDGQFWFDTATDFLRFGATAGNQTVASLNQTQTLTNKTISGSSNTLTNIQDSSLSANVALLNGNQTVTGKKTFSTPPLLPIVEVASGGQHTVPDVSSDTFGLLDAVQTFSNKSFNSIAMLGSLDFNDFAIADFKLENRTSNPSQGAGKLYYNSNTGELRYSTGTEWRTVTSNVGGLSLDALSAVAPLAYDNTTGVFSLQAATTSADGYLDQNDWDTFNNKQDALPLSAKGDTLAHNGTSLVARPACPDGQTYVADALEISGWKCGTAGGVTDATGLTYTPGASGDWDVVPTNGQEGFDELAQRVNDAEADITTAQNAADVAQSDIDAHIADTTGAHAASAVSVTPAGNLSSTQVQAALEELQADIDAGSGGGTWGSITGTLSDQTDLQSALDAKAPLASPSFTGTVTLPTGLTGLLKAASGVVSTATSGTDYAPATSGTGYQKGNGSGGFTNQATPIPLADGGTGATTKTAAFDALSPNTTKGDVTLHNGTNNVRVGVGQNEQALVADASASAGVSYASQAQRKNWVSNDSFEYATATSGWTTSGATFAADTGTKVYGKQSMKMTFTSGAGSISQSFTPPVDYAGKSIQHTAWVKTTDPAIDVCSLRGGSVYECRRVPADGIWHEVGFTYTDPGSGTRGISIARTTGGASDTWIDGVYVGPYEPNVPAQISADYSKKARIANNGTASITSQTSSWISSVSRGSQGSVTVNIASGTFTSTPACSCSPEAEARTCAITSPSTSSLLVRTVTDANANSDIDFSLTCSEVNSSAKLAGAIITDEPWYYLSSKSPTRVTGAAPSVIGEYRSYLRGASSLTFSETNGAPSSAPSSANGFTIYGGNQSYSAADASGQPSRYEIFIGKEKSYRVHFYPSSGKSGMLDASPISLGTSNLYGYLTQYDPTTGILNIAPNLLSGGTFTHWIGNNVDATTNTNTSAYFDIQVFSNPLAAGMKTAEDEILMATPNGYGSTNTKIRRYTTTVNSIGDAVTCTDSSTLGMSCVVNKDGFYSVSAYDYSTAGPATIGISKNSTSLTTNIGSLPIGQVVCQTDAPTNLVNGCSRVTHLNKGDIIRSHGSSANATTSNATFSIAKAPSPFEVAGGMGAPNKTFRARFASNGTLQGSSGWVTGNATNGSSGIYTIPVNAGVFSTPPICHCNNEVINTRYCNAVPASSGTSLTSIMVNTI